MPSPLFSSSHASQLWHQLWQLVSWLEELGDKPHYKVWQRRIRRYTRPASLMGATLTLVLLSINPRLVLATGTGVGAALALYYLAQQRWILPVFWQDLVRSLNRQRGMAIAAGTTATLSTYAALSLGQPFVDPAMAIGLILEGTIILGLLLWLTGQRAQDTVAASPAISSLDAHLPHLTDPSPLKRLLTIQQSTHLALAPDAPAGMRLDLADCFRLMLAAETDPTLQQALIRHLSYLAPPDQLGEGTAPFTPPLVVPQPDFVVEPSGLEPEFSQNQA